MIPNRVPSVLPASAGAPPSTCAAEGTGAEGSSPASSRVFRALPTICRTSSLSNGLVR